jgi:hypothetical protein
MPDLHDGGSEGGSSPFGPLQLGPHRLLADRVVTIDWLDGDCTAVSYSRVEQQDGTVLGHAQVPAGDGATIDVEDEWTTTGREICVRRTLTVRGSSDRAFASAIVLTRPGWHDWGRLAAVLPGVVYGDAGPVGDGFLGSAAARRSGLRDLVVREDRASAPGFAVHDTHDWLAVLHPDVDGATTAADGLDIEGDPLVDERFRFASLGGRMPDAGRGLGIGVWFPGTEGDWTYESGGLPLRQRRRRRGRFHPVRDGLVQEYTAAFRGGELLPSMRTGPVLVDTPSAEAGPGADEQVLHQLWDWCWTTMKPDVNATDVAHLLDPVLEVLASQVQSHATLTGIGLESDPLAAAPLAASSAAVMGFVGANTDAAYLLIRHGRHRAAGAAILDTFAALPADPSGGEGFDLRTGAITTYRTLDGEPAVFLRALAEGWRAALRAEQWAARAGAAHPHWSEWASAGADWLARQQNADGSFPRAWRRDGTVLQASSTATVLAAPLLVDTGHLGAAVAAGEFAWERFGRRGSYAGATLDNPDVVDKEASVLALEAFLVLHGATGDERWLERARRAARIAETWIHLWNLPMPVDADPANSHWKPGRPTTGMQLITTGVTMSDGFLAVNAAAFADLARRTGDEHFLEVARLVHHGTTSMLATIDDRFDLHAPGWQQEHWGFGPRRGYGLNRSWLPWAAVAVADGVYRVIDLGEDLAELVLA